MTEKEALLWVLGILGSLCAATITIDKVLEIIHKYVKKAQEPDNAQNKRLDEMDKRLPNARNGLCATFFGAWARFVPLRGNRRSKPPDA